MILLLKKKKGYYPQAFLKECKYIEKEVIRHIIEDIEFFLVALMKNRPKVNIVMCFWESDFENVFMREKFENVFFEIAILKIYFW